MLRKRVCYVYALHTLGLRVQILAVLENSGLAGIKM